MARIDDAAAIRCVGWRDNRDGFDVALAVNRLLSAGAAAWWLTNDHEGADAGDYLVELTARRQDALATLGVVTRAWHGDIPAAARRLAAPAACLFAGTASKFPYFAYYAVALLRLGVDYVPCDGAMLAAGALDDANVLVLPGGFATWGIDAAEDAPGADAQVRDFLDAGGAAIGSCGGAFYLSAGRPGWTGTAQAKPLYTHEYLQSGAGVVSVAMRPGPLGLGCPPTMEMPYYHGPLYDLVGAGVDVAATFHSLTLPARLAIDNPLDDARFRRDMAGKPAILLASDPRAAGMHAARAGSPARVAHRAVLFSPHPEMGDLVRKYIALDGYVRHYLPIRGFGTLRDTLRHYRVTEAPSFRLIVNALHDVMSDARPAGAGAPAAIASETVETDLVEVCEAASARLPPFGSGEEGDLLQDVAAGIRARLARLRGPARAAAETVEGSTRLRASYTHLVRTMSEHARSMPAPSAAQALMELDLGVALLECWTRVAQFDRTIAGRA